MKPFSLEEYLANPSRKVVTRDGRNVRIICTDRKHEIYPIVALIKDSEDIERAAIYSADGFLYAGSHLNGDDLFFAPVKKKGKVLVYKNKLGTICCDKVIFDGQPDYVIGCDNFCTVADIEWEE